MDKYKPLHAAKRNKIDEFYTLLPDIENEMAYYRGIFNNKTVYCNCDDPRSSNFPKYFLKNFNSLNLKRIISTGYVNSGATSVFMDIAQNCYNNAANNAKFKLKKLKENGDFRSAECVDLLKKADIVVSNPPFSLFREYISLLLKHNKKFIILGNQNAISYKDIFHLMKNNKLWLGATNKSKTTLFEVPGTYDKKHVVINNKKHVGLRLTCWFTNIKHEKMNDFLPLTQHYAPKNYKIYDNYDAINIDSIKDIPMDYDGLMGVPITFMYKYNPKQFKIITFRRGNDNKDLTIDGKYKYIRIIIKKIK